MARSACEIPQVRGVRGCGELNRYCGSSRRELPVWVNGKSDSLRNGSVMRMNKAYLVFALAGVVCAGAIAGAGFYFANQPGEGARSAGVDQSRTPDANASGNPSASARGGQAGDDAVSAQRGVKEMKAQPASEAKRELSDVEHMVRNVYADVAQLPSSRLGDIKDDKHDVVVIDVRESEEFGVSHLDGAIRVDPDIWTSSFVSRFGKEAAGKTFVFYCSVGVRSSKLAGRVQSKLKELGAAGVYNLEGGIFRWHNENRQLVDGSGETQFVHKYDDSWGRLVARQDLAVTQP